MPPEAASNGKFGRESDVHSFGVVALEIACGRKVVEPTNRNEDQIYLVDWVRGLYGMGDLLIAADRRLHGVFDEKEMERLMIVGLWCSQVYFLLRPKIRQVVQVLNVEAPLPTLPSQQVPAPIIMTHLSALCPLGLLLLGIALSVVLPQLHSVIHAKYVDICSDFFFLFEVKFYIYAPLRTLVPLLLFHMIMHFCLCLFFFFFSFMFTDPIRLIVLTSSSKVTLPICHLPIGKVK